MSPIIWTGLHLELLGIFFAHQQVMSMRKYDRTNRVTGNNDKAEQGDMEQAGYVIEKKIRTEHMGVQEDGITELLECHGLSSMR